MDRQTIKLVSVMVTLTLVWLVVTQWIMPPPAPRPAQQQSQQPPATNQDAATRPAATRQAEGGQPTTHGTTQGSTQSVAVAPATRDAPTVATPAPAKPLADGGPPAAIKVGLGDTSLYTKEPGKFVLTLRTTSLGAALSEAVVHTSRKEVQGTDPYVFQHPYEEASPLSPALATRRVWVNGAEVDLGGVHWNVEASTQNSVTYAVRVRGAGGEPLVEVRKTYAVPENDKDGKGYEARVRYEVRNLSAAPATVKLAFNGVNVPASDSSRFPTSLVQGYNNEGAVELKHKAAADLDAKHKTFDIAPQNLLWSGVASAYFNAIVKPDPGKQYERVGSIKAEALNPDSPAEQRRIAFDYESAEMKLAAGATAELPLDVYLGPKQRAVLNSDYYEAFPRHYDETLVLKGDWCGVCTWSWLVSSLVWMLDKFHFIFKDWGLAIIGLVVLVRLALHPITKRSQISMSKMAKMGPEIERIKKKHGDDKEAVQREMMEFYKTQGVTPILGCLPMLLQMPIWIALWSALQSEFALRHAPFLYGWTWIKDLSQPDALISWRPVKFFFFEVGALNVLPLVMAVVFYVQAQMQPKPETETPEQAQQRKMMKVMTLIFPLLLYSGPSGLNLYIMTSTLIGIWESKRVRDHIKEQEAREKAGPVLVDTGPATAPKRRSAGAKEAAPAPRRGLAGWLAELQAKAEDMKREAEKRKGKPGGGR